MMYICSLIDQNLMKQLPNRRTIRLQDYDYSQRGMYFITICTYQRKNLFGKIQKEEMILNDFGKIAYEEWFMTAKLRPNVSLGAFVVMPNHVHGIIIIDDIPTRSRGELNSPVSNSPVLNSPVSNSPVLNSPVSNSPVSNSPASNSPIVNNHIIYDNNEYCEPVSNGRIQFAPTGTSQTIGAIVRGYKSAVTRQINQKQLLAESVWQRNYHEHIIRNMQSYQNISEYIQNNPKKWFKDRFLSK